MSPQEALDRDQARVAIDREAVWDILDALLSDNPYSNMDAAIDRIVALVQPVAGVVLSPEEAALARRALVFYDVKGKLERPDDVVRLAARLEAAG